MEYHYYVSFDSIANSYKPPISYKDWELTVGAGKNPKEQILKYWRYMAAARAEGESPHKYIDWLYIKELKLSKAPDEEYIAKIRKEDFQRKVRFNLKWWLILTGSLYIPEIFKVYSNTLDKNKLNQDFTVNDFFMDL